MKFNQILGAAVVFCFTAGSAVAGDLVVIVNSKNASASMTANEVSAVFLGKSAALPSGGVAAMVDQPSGGPINDQFYSKVAGKSGPQVKAIWSRLAFSGKAIPPKELATSADVKKFVASNADGIGYIEKAAVDSSVKVVLSID
jgi:ABC-type phosphate transport system substrate-binding protein